MKNTIYLDSDFNFLLLENEEEDNGLNQTKIYINIPTSDATNQELEISVAGGAPITESIPSETLVNFELSQQYWADNGDVEITPKNDDITGDTITIHFPGIFTTSAALNYIADDEFEVLAQSEEFAEEGSAGGGSGSGSGGGSAFDFVETIRNIGLRLLDEPSNISAYYNARTGEVELKWTDPADITTLEPVPCEWAGTIVVRKKDSAPIHKWDGVLITDSTTRDQYANAALVDGNIAPHRTYFYGIFPYHVALDDLDNPIKHYRYTKAVKIETGDAETIQTLLNTSESFVSDLFDNLHDWGDTIYTPPWEIATTGEYINTLVREGWGNESFCCLDSAFSKGEATKMYVDIEGIAHTNPYHLGNAKIYGSFVKSKPNGYGDCWGYFNNNSWKTTAFADLPPRSSLARTRFEVPLDDVNGNFYIMFESTGFQAAIIREISFDAPIIVKG